MSDEKQLSLEMLCEMCKKHVGALIKHRCPYQADVNNDESFRCNCCPSCEQQCADDI